MNTITIGIDSQCLSYLIDAIQGIKKPTGSLAPEKTALYRIYLYTPGTLFVTETVINECAAIRDEARKELHDSYIGVLFDEAQIQQLENVELRAKKLEAHHNGKNDCRILAESEDANFNVLLTYDNDFLTHLQGVSQEVKICRPTEYWNQLNISHGANPDKRPSNSNPLSNNKWWEW